MYVNGFFVTTTFKLPFISAVEAVTVMVCSVAAPSAVIIAFALSKKLLCRYYHMLHTPEKSVSLISMPFWSYAFAVYVKLLFPLFGISIDISPSTAISDNTGLYTLTVLLAVISPDVAFNYNVAVAVCCGCQHPFQGIPSVVFSAFQPLNSSDGISMLIVDRIFLLYRFHFTCDAVCNISAPIISILEAVIYMFLFLLKFRKHLDYLLMQPLP